TLIGETAAEDIALADAGASRTDVTYLNSWLEYDDGRMECYEVEFAVGSTVYEYKIGLYDGTIRSKDVETRGGTGVSSGNTTQSTLIGEDAALSAALSHVGVSASDASKTKVKLDRDDGVYVYEVEFTVGWLEYEYEIDAASGSILSFEIDD
ncbi:MAG: PepSY domain-containing protein, partial [Oscillospiraceae bacterium]|nr:PepSY domain-containing protein [Oscillospiraceae bacterium]